MSKPRLSYAATFGRPAANGWDAAFERIRILGEGAKLTDDEGVIYTVAWIHDDPDWIRFTFKRNGKQTGWICRRGDPTLLEMQPVTIAGGGDVGEISGPSSSPNPQ